MTQAGILHIGSDASRDNGARQVGSATTIPRHPTALYYNTSTQAEAVDEYNWLYTSRADGGSGYCEDNPSTATCLPAPLGADGFTSYIVPTDANFDLSFILSNDPRPFYSHTSNFTDDRLGYYLLDAILGKYRAVFTAEAPLVNLTLTDAVDATRSPDPLGGDWRRLGDRLRAERSDHDLQSCRRRSAVHCPDRHHRQRHGSPAVWR